MMSRGLKLVVAVVVLLVLLVAGGAVALFLVENADWVVIRVPVLRADISDPIASELWEMPLAALLAISFGAGLLLASLLLVPGALRRAFERGRQRRFIDELEGELADLRNLPVTAPAPLEDLEPEEQTGSRKRSRGVGESRPQRTRPGRPRTTRPTRPSLPPDDEAQLMATLQPRERRPPSERS